MIAGVDGCKAGWVAVLDTGDGNPEVEVFAKFGELLTSGARRIVIDVPIGIMADAPRAADRAARAMLRHRACCVFSAPYRAMLGARSHAEACSIRELIDGKRCSRQAFEIFSKITEVDALMTPALQDGVAEGHPEVSFAAMRGGRPVDHGKKTMAGREDRLEALEPYFPRLAARIAGRRPPGVGRDDLLDAYAMLWTARRVDTGSEIHLPSSGDGTGQRDARGLRAQIVA